MSTVASGLDHRHPEPRFPETPVGVLLEGPPDAVAPMGGVDGEDVGLPPLVLRVHAGADPPDRDAVQHRDVHVLGLGIQDPGEIVVLAFLPAIRVEGVVDEARDVLLHQRETGAQDRSDNSRRTDRWSNV